MRGIARLASGAAAGAHVGTIAHVNTIASAHVNTGTPAHTRTCGLGKIVSFGSYE